MIRRSQYSTGFSISTTDYFSAGASVMYGLFYIPLRLFNIHQRDINKVQPYIYVWAGLCGFAFLAHVSYTCHSLRFRIHIIWRRMSW